MHTYTHIHIQLIIQSVCLAGLDWDPNNAVNSVYC